MFSKESKYDEQHEISIAAADLRRLGNIVQTDETEKYARREDIPILMKIPDRRDIAENYSRGVLMCQVIPGIKQQFKQLMADIQHNVNNRVRS